MMAAINNQKPGMTLKQLLQDVTDLQYLPEIEIQGLALDSRKVKPGYAFFALEGQFDHGLAYAEAALARGAVVVLCDSKFDQYCEQILSKLMTRVVCVPVRGLQNKLGEIAGKFYGLDDHEMFLTGVTGTDGKTSVSHFIAQSLKMVDGSAAVIGTLGNGNIDKLEESTHTTPDVISLHEMINEFSEDGIKDVAMEVSSHGLDQERTAGVMFDVAVLTNLSRDHLDYHGSIEAYKEAKKKLFNVDKSNSLVVNIDDELGEEIYQENKDSRVIWLYGLDRERAIKSDNYAYASDVKHTQNGISFMLNSSKGASELNVSLIGAFNIYNVLASFCVLMQKNVNFNHAIKYLSKLKTVPGRMELLSFEEKPSVVIDYAHTPEAIRQALLNLRKHATGKLVCVFGCGGDRDTGKRSLMAEAAEKQSDLVIVTNDNPRNEDPDQIIDDIKQGITNPQQFIIESDRKKAIEQAIKLASENDVILIAGKGHEGYQIIGNEKIDFSDKQVALACLEETE